MSTIIGVTCGITDEDLNVCLSSPRASSMPIRAATDHPSHAVTIGRARTTWYQQVERVKRYQQVERVKRPHAVSTNRVAQASFNKAADSQCASGGWSEQILPSHRASYTSVLYVRAARNVLASSGTPAGPCLPVPAAAP